MTNLVDLLHFYIPTRAFAAWPKKSIGEKPFCSSSHSLSQSLLFFFEYKGTWQKFLCPFLRSSIAAKLTVIPSPPHIFLCGTSSPFSKKKDFQVLKGSFCVELQCALCSTPKRKHSSLTYLINVSSVHFQLSLQYVGWHRLSNCMRVA